MSPNLTTALLEERLKKLTPVEVSELNATLYVRPLSFKEGLEFNRRIGVLSGDELTDERVAFMDDVTSRVVVDPGTGNPIFTTENPPSAVLPVSDYMAVALAILRAIGIVPKVTQIVSAVPAAEPDAAPDNASPLAVTEEDLRSLDAPAPLPQPDTTLSAPSTEDQAPQASATDSSTDSPPN